MRCPQNVRSLATTGLVLAIFPIANIAGLVVSLVAFRRLGRSREPRIAALFGMVIAPFTIAITIGGAALIVPPAIHAVQICKELGNGVHWVSGTKYTCNM